MPTFSSPSYSLHDESGNALSSDLIWRHRGMNDPRRIATRLDRCPEVSRSAIAPAAAVIFWLCAGASPSPGAPGENSPGSRAPAGGDGAPCRAAWSGARIFGKILARPMHRPRKDFPENPCAAPCGAARGAVSAGRGPAPRRIFAGGSRAGAGSCA